LIFVGVKAGVLLADVYTNDPMADGAAFSSQTRFMVGPTVEVHLPLHFSVELDAVWRQSSFSTAGGHFTIGPEDSSVSDWQLPLLAKYQFPVGRAHLFFDAGPVYRHVSTEATSVPRPSRANSAGAAIGVGVSLQFLHLRLEPEVRYTRWIISAFSAAYAGPVQSTDNQADVLVGLTF
jgi:hypothetical protein